MRQPQMLLYDALSTVAREGIKCTVIDRKDRAVVHVEEKNNRDYVFDKIVGYMQRYSPTHSVYRTYHRPDYLQSMRGTSYDWTVGDNLEEDQFNATICSVISKDGFAINVT